MKAGSAVTAGFFAAAVVEVRISGIGHLLRARVYALGMRILLVSQMYPGPDDPDLGVFVQQLEEELRRRGNEVEPAVIDHRGGGKRRYAALARRSLAASRRFRPDVVYVHFLVPSGLLAALGSRAPLVVTAHGRDVRNIGAFPGIRAATRLVVRRAEAVIAVSDYLRRELEAKVPEARGKTEVVDCGVDLERFTVKPAPDGPTRYLCVGSLTERKNVVRLAEAFSRLGEGSLTFVGDGPLRGELSGRGNGRVAGAGPQDRGPGARGAWASRSGWRRSRRWPPAAPSSPPGSADRRSSSPRTPACSSIPW